LVYAKKIGNTDNFQIRAMSIDNIATMIYNHFNADWPRPGFAEPVDRAQDIYILDASRLNPACFNQEAIDGVDADEYPCNQPGVLKTNYFNLPDVQDTPKFTREQLGMTLNQQTYRFEHFKYGENYQDFSVNTNKNAIEQRIKNNIEQSIQTYFANQGLVTKQFSAEMKEAARKEKARLAAEAAEENFEDLQPALDGARARQAEFRQAAMRQASIRKAEMDRQEEAERQAAAAAQEAQEEAARQAAAAAAQAAAAAAQAAAATAQAESDAANAEALKYALIVLAVVALGVGLGVALAPSASTALQI